MGGSGTHWSLNTFDWFKTCIVNSFRRTFSTASLGNLHGSNSGISEATPHARWHWPSSQTPSRSIGRHSTALLELRTAFCSRDFCSTSCSIWFWATTRVTRICSESSRPTGVSTLSTRNTEQNSSSISTRSSVRFSTYVRTATHRSSESDLSSPVPPARSVVTDTTTESGQIPLP